MTNLTGTLYAKYVYERLEASIVENEFGFIVYNSKGEDAFIIEMYIDDSVRSTGKGKALLALFCDRCKQNGIKRITANIFLADKNSSDTLAKSIATGFKVFQAHNGCISVIKGVE